MGSSNIGFTIAGKASVEKIKKAFARRVKEDRAYNGHRDGYSGDFQTVSGVNFNHLGQVFKSYNEAQDYALDRSEKWGPAVAVYFSEKDETTNRRKTYTLVAGWCAE